MRLFITGATGFLGTHTVDAAVCAGHEVVALARRPPVGRRWTHPSVRVVLGDLRAAEDLRDDLLGADAIIHLAAAKTGDFHEQLAGTVVATERLLAQLPPDSAPRLVHVSTFSVYDYDAIGTGDLLSEGSPTETDGRDRDAYTRTKLLQERLVRRWADAGGRAVIIRPGAVWGAGELWSGGHSMTAGSLGLAIGPRSALKLTYVENCAEAFVLAASADAAVGATINIVDDEQPTQTQFAAALRAAGADVARSVPVPYIAAMGVAATAEFVKERVLGGRARTPAILSPPRLAAMRRHHRYDNRRAAELLGWRPRYGLAEAAARALAEERGS